MKNNTQQTFAICAALVLTGVSAAFAADPPGKASSLPASPPAAHATNPGAAPVLPPVILNVRLSTGNFIPMGAASSGALNSAPAVGPNHEVQTLAIEMFNRTPKYMENLEVRYKIYKVVVTFKSRKTTSGGVTYYDRVTNESAPKVLKEGKEKISLKVGERKIVNAQATLFVPEDENRAIIVNRNTHTTGVNTTREEIYGYIVEVVQDGTVIAEKLSPASIRADVKTK